MRVRRWWDPYPTFPPALFHREEQSCHGCSPITPAIHAAEGEKRASSIVASTNSVSDTSPPPQRAGCHRSPEAIIEQGLPRPIGERLSRLSSAALSASCGATCFAFSTSVICYSPSGRIAASIVPIQIDLDAHLVTCLEEFRRPHRATNAARSAG